MGALFGGRQPHYQSIVVGGVTQLPDIDRISKFKAMLDEVGDFVRNIYIPDVLILAAGPLLSFAQSGIGSGHENYLSYGGFELDESGDVKLFRQGAILNGKLDRVSDFDPEKIDESTEFSWYRSPGAGEQREGSSIFNLQKDEAYSFVKAPRYEGKAVEVGPLARLLIAREENLLKLINDRGLKVGAFLRHVARALEAGILVEQMYVWLDELSEAMVRPGFKIHNERLSHLGENAEGAAYLEGPQGALYHRIMVKDGKIDDYQIIDASTWNASPRDENGLRGQLEEALIGTPVPDADNPINVLRVVRSFNPCLACAVHMLKIDSRK
jgi:hydrogenase large subunit